MTNYTKTKSEIQHDLNNATKAFLAKGGKIEKCPYYNLKALYEGDQMLDVLSSIAWGVRASSINIH